MVIRDIKLYTYVKTFYYFITRISVQFVPTWGHLQ